MNKTKPYEIYKHAVLEAFQQVKANGGAAEVDNLSLEKFGSNMKGNLYRIWDGMSSGIIRILGVPTVADRIAQMASVLELFIRY